MPLSYVSDDAGKTIAVQIPIEDWNLIKKQYPQVGDLQESLPQWQQDLLNKRLQSISDNPTTLHPIQELYEALDSED